MEVATTSNVSSDDQVNVISDGKNPATSPTSHHSLFESDDSVSNELSVGIEEFSPGGTKYWIPDVEVKPVVGFQFSSFDEAWDSYKSYAQKGGFEVKKVGYYDLASGETVKYFYCIRQGYKSATKKSDDKKQVRRKRSSCRCGCPAHMKVQRIASDLFEIIAFVEKHNHSLVRKNDVQFLRAYRQLTYTQKQFIHQVSNANLGPVRSFKLMKQIYGGFEKVGATAIDCKNFRRDLNMFIGERDAQMAVEKLLSRKEFKAGFFVDYHTDEDKALTGIFWADEVGIRNYGIFGDVVSFDATFRSNKYKMVFVPFTGIDNHNRCVTFAAGLLAKENIQSYTWLLDAFKRAVGRDPDIVVTDQDPAMRQAIVNVFPTTRHRLCMWHIMQKLTAKVGPTLSSDDRFKKRLCDIVWNDRISIDYFETKWAGIIDDFNLHENKWLSDMFAIRSDWIPAYYVDEPLSGLMRTTSRSESENHFFGTLTNSNLTLVEFISHYDTAMDAQRYTHDRNDHESRYTAPDMKTELEIEVKAAQIYTRTLFFDVQEEIQCSVLYCHSVNVVDYDGIIKCFVRDSSEEVNRNPFSANSLYEALFNQLDAIISCSCKRFECYGLLCRHIFLVYRMFRINEIPAKYVHKRWSKTKIPIVYQSDRIQSTDIDASANEADVVVREVYRAVDYCVNILVNNMEQLTLYRDKQKNLMVDAELYVRGEQMPNKKAMLCTMLGVSEPAEVNIHVPRGIRNKGSGSGKRFKSKIEIVKEGYQKQLRQCKYCEKYVRDHDTRNCPVKKQDMEASSSNAPSKSNKGKNVVTE